MPHVVPTYGPGDRQRPTVFGVRDVEGGFTTPPFDNCAANCPSTVAPTGADDVSHMWLLASLLSGDVTQVVTLLTADGGGVVLNQPRDLNSGAGAVQPATGTPIYGLRAGLPDGVVVPFRYPSMALAARGARTPSTDLVAQQTYGAIDTSTNTSLMCPPAQVLQGVAFPNSGARSSLTPLCRSVFDMARGGYVGDGPYMAQIPTDEGDPPGMFASRCGTYVDHVYSAGIDAHTKALYLRCASQADYQSFRTAINSGLLLNSDPTCALVDGNDSTNRDACNALAVNYCRTQTGHDRDVYCACIDAAANPMPAPDPTHAGATTYLPVRCTHPACVTAQNTRSATSPGTWFGGRTPNTLPVSESDCPHINVCQVYTQLRAGGGITYRDNSIDVRCGTQSPPPPPPAASTTGGPPPPAVHPPGTVTSTTHTTTGPPDATTPRLPPPQQPPPVTGTPTDGGAVALLRGVLTDATPLVVGGHALPISKGHATIVALLLLVAAIATVLA